MALWNDVSSTLVLAFYYLGFLLLVDSRVINIYSSTKPHSILANLGQDGWTNYTIQWPQYEKHALQLLSVEPQNGVLRMISKPNCSSLRQNPFVLTVESTSVSNPSQRMLNTLSVFTYGNKCFRKFRRKLSRYSPVGWTVMSLRDVTRGQRGLNSSSLKLRNTLAMKYFMIGANFRYLVLRKSLHQVQESDLSLDIVFPAKYSKDNKQTLLAKVRLFIDDDGTNSVKLSRRIRRRASFSPPRFTSSHLTARISEDASKGARVITVRAQDTNSGNAGKLTYSMSASQNLLSQQFFRIDGNTGLITTQAALDREKMAIHYFRVKAEYEQHRSLYVETDLTIFVQDVNDNAPKFESPSYSKIIAEDFLIGDTILEVRARDPDDGSNADIRYKILNNGGVNSIFQIGQSNGAISVNKPLDRETVEQYSLSIQASDRGTPLKTDQTIVSITVTDVNDCAPQFSKNGYSATIREDVKTGYLVLTVSASDKDTGQNAEVGYSFSSGNDQELFSINRLNGQIKVNKKLDYEDTSRHNLFVVAQDKGDPPQYNETSVEITLLDVNDNSPQFVSTSFQETVSEDQQVGYTFTRVEAHDFDDGSNKEIVYSIVERNLPFAINSLTGDLYLTQKLDRETVSRYVFQIKAQDKGNPPLDGQAKVTVSVRDVNDNPPRFTQPSYRASVEEKARLGTDIVQVTAVDPDLGQSNVYYSFLRQQRCFRISGYGAITLSCRLDYSKTKAYVLTVRARDNLLESFAQVVINVTDSNTHKPVFKERIYQVRISEATSVGGRVLAVSARDNDQGLNAKITYAFVKTVRDFKINANTGVITVSNSLDRETTPLYRFEVTATDHGKPPLKGTTNVHITVTDVNDNKPRFLQSNYGKSIKENVPPGTKVVEVSATDDDEGSNKAIIYSFAQTGDGGGAFQIDSTQGVIRTLLPLDREKIPVYDLTVVATDKGRPRMSSSVKVKVTLEDVRDSPPRFEKDPYQVIIKENVDVRSTILQVKAVSQDLVSGGKVTYSIVSGNYPLTFVIQRDTGNIQTNRELDYETQPVYILKVRATSSPFFVEATVNITLIDVNDNAPVLQNFFMVINVMDDKFPQQPKFKIPAYDPDVSDRLTYQIESKTQGNWVKLNTTTGDLMVSPTLLNTGKPVHLKVRVSDGVKHATASGQILVTSITPKMLNSSLTIDIANMGIQQFFDSSYEELLTSLASVIQCNIDQIALFDIKAKTVKASSPDEDDSDQLKIWLVVHKANRAEFFDPQYIRDLIYINMVQISERAKLTLLPFEDGLCVTEMCNFPLATSRKSCISFTVYEDVSHTYSSSKVVFRTVGVYTGYDRRCPCTSDYRGDICDTVLNLCYSNPCQDNGKCISIEESYSCICNPGRTGVNCEIVVSTSKCPALPDVPTSQQHLQKNPCKNGGVCTDLSGGGFSCQCQNSDTVDGPLCELTTRSFKMGSTVVYSALKQRWRLHIAMEFVTTHHSGLLLFNGRYDGKHDFIAVEVMRGQVQFTFSLFSKSLTVRSNVNGGVSDGKWHKVEVSFQNQTGIIVVDDCKLAVAVNSGTHVGSFGCAAAQRLEEQGEKTAYRSLDLTGPLMIGGLLQLPIKFPVSSKFFTGCIRRVYINHKFLDLGQPLFVNGTSPKCSAMSDYCKISPCQRGNCSNILGTQQCDCPAKYGGKKCESVLKYTQSFLGQSFNKVGYSSANSLPWTLSLRFRTAKSSGSLVETSFSSGTSALLAVVNGKLTYNLNNELELLLPHIEVNDTRWHSVELLWTQTSVNITVDFIYKFGVLSAKGNDLGGLKQFFIGARRNSTPRAVFGGFTGCIEGLSLGTQIDTSLGNNHNTRSGCSMPKHCQSNPCPSYSSCEEQFDSYKCLCPLGYVGKQCVDVCSFKPCRHGQCIRTRDSKKGFKCSCPKEYTGEYCEVHMEIPCPDKFFSASNIGVCGPCMCAVGMNLNPVCNKSTGECYCSPKHYRKILRYRYVEENVNIPVFSEGCFKCDCEEIGSIGGYCNVRNGQCPCQRGKDGAKDVIGRQCNQCADKQGEITNGRGCVVINTSCPKAYAEEIWWRRASFGATARQKCPFGSSGFATRVCDVDDGWQKPSVLECVSNSFLALQKQLSNLTTGVVNWSPEFALGLARKLELAITLSPRLYSKDIVIALTIITTLFDYESQQNSSTLVSASTNEFAKILLQSASMLFNSDNKEVWNTVQENSAGTAALLQKMENFSGNLANNLPYLKRSAHRYKRTTENILLPYTILTPNIVLELHPIFVRAFSGLSYPSQSGLYEDGPYKIWRNISNRVDLPPTFFKDIKGIRNDIGIGFMIINDIGDLLPKSFDVKIRNTKYNIEVSSDVISVSSPELADLPLPTPIRITFANQLVNRSDYICVHWNYSVPDTIGGGWSREGCTLESSNATHTVCSCEHLTAFAVLSDLNLEYPEAEAFALRLVTYIGVAVSLALLLLAFVLFMCIRKLKSNAKSIHKNLVAAIFIAELTFLVGINQTENVTICRFVAIVLHYFFCSVFSWMFVEGLHMYRRLREKRNVDMGKMSFYYFMGWGCPIIVVGICVGLATEGYGNEKFCWMSTDGTLIWTFTVPIIIVVGLNVLVFIMALYMSLEKQSRRRRRHHHHHHDDSSSNPNAGLRATAAVLPLIGVSFAFGLLLVNKDLEMFHYVFAGFALCQGLFIFVFYLLLDRSVRKEFKNVYMRWKTGDKTYGIQKPVQHFKRSYHPGEMAPLRSPYDLGDDGNATSTSTTEPSSSVRSSVTSRMTTDPSITASMPDDDDTSAPDGDTEKAKYPNNPELELARKLWEQPDKSEPSTTQPESSSDEEEEERPSSPGIPSDSSDSEDEEAPTGNGWPKDNRPKKKKRKTPFYASDGPMHSTPMETTPEEEPLREADGESESSETGDEVMPAVTHKKDGPAFNSVPEIIKDKGVSGSAATSDTTPSVSESLKKKPLKSALKKPKTPILVAATEEVDATTGKEAGLSDRHRHKSHRHHHEKPRSRTSSGSGDHKEKKRKFRKKMPKKKETVIEIGGEQHRVKLGDTADFQDSQV